jgi:hypothetical protein
VPVGSPDPMNKMTERDTAVSIDQKEAFEKYREQIILIFRRYNLIHVIEEGHYVNKFSNHIGHLRPKYNQDGQIDFQEQDLYNIVHETRFAIANTILLSEIGLAPFEAAHYQGNIIPQFSSTIVDTRFFYFVDDVFMRLYNFWNRVANFLNIFFQIEKDPKKSYFTREFLQKLSLKIGTDSNFQSIKLFQESEYKDIINKKRRKVVHRESSSTTYFINFLNSLKNLREQNRLLYELTELQKERDEYPHYFVTSYQRMLQGLDEMLALIKDNIK